MAHLINSGAEPVIRHSAHQFPVADREGKAVNLAQVLSDCVPGEMRTLEVQFTAPNGKTYPILIHAYRLSETCAQAARRRCRKKKK